jgi:hypothetical protein
MPANKKSTDSPQGDQARKKEPRMNTNGRESRRTDRIMNTESSRSDWPKEEHDSVTMIRSPAPQPHARNKQAPGFPSCISDEAPVFGQGTPSKRLAAHLDPYGDLRFLDHLSLDTLPCPQPHRGCVRGGQSSLPCHSHLLRRRASHSRLLRRSLEAKAPYLRGLFR